MLRFEKISSISQKPNGHSKTKNNKNGFKMKNHLKLALEKTLMTWSYQNVQVN
jgi:hypothetical protein